VRPPINSYLLELCRSDSKTGLAAHILVANSEGDVAGNGGVVGEGEDGHPVRGGLHEDVPERDGVPVRGGHGEPDQFFGGARVAHFEVVLRHRLPG